MGDVLWSTAPNGEQAGSPRCGHPGNNINDCGHGFRGRRATSQEQDIVLVAFSDHVIGPDTGLDLANMGLSKVQHTEAGLTNATSNRER